MNLRTQFYFTFYRHYNIAKTRGFKFSCIHFSNTNIDQDDKTTHFGFKTIKQSEKTKEVYSVFQNVADSYDKMNDAMSFGIHRLWKDIFINRLNPEINCQLLDCAGGTGDITFRYLKYFDKYYGTKSLKNPVTVFDINENMLEVGKIRAKQQGFTSENGYKISWDQGNAEDLPYQNDSYTAYTIAFGIRNVTNINKVLTEAYRVLKPGGRFLCLEFSHVDNFLLKWIYDQYSFQFIPVLGTLIAGQWQPYQYLVESIRRFPNQEEFKEMISQAGFKNVIYESLTFGIVAIHIGYKI